MKTRLFALVIAMLFVIGTTCTAEQKTPRGERQAKGAQAGQAGRMQDNPLGLSKDQMIKVRDIVKKFREDAQEVLKSDASKEEKQTKLQTLRTKAGEAIMAILTPEQQAKAKETGWVDRILSPRKPGAPMLGAVLRQLDLSAEQRASVKTILEDMATQAKAIKDDTSLTPQQKRAKAAELRRATIAKIEAVLTPEQLAKFRELLAKQPQPGPVRGNRK